MLLKASKSILTIFNQYFCENPSKLVSLADFASQKKKVILPHIAVNEIFEKKNIHFWIRTTLTKWTFFSIGPSYMVFMGDREQVWHFWTPTKKKGKKGKKRAKFDFL